MINMPHPELPGVTVTTPIYAGSAPWWKFQECEAGPRDQDWLQMHKDKHKWPDGLPAYMVLDEVSGMMMGMQICSHCGGSRAIFCPPSNPAVLVAKKQAFLEKLQVALKEKALLLAELELWNDVEEQGHKPDTVSSFGFDPDRLHRGPLRKMWNQPGGGFRHTPSHSNPFFAPLDGGGCRTRWHNILKLKDGTEVVLQHALLAPEDRLEHRFPKELGRCPLPTPSSLAGPLMEVP